MTASELLDSFNNLLKVYSKEEAVRIINQENNTNFAVSDFLLASEIEDILMEDFEKESRIINYYNTNY
jgi:phosphosulfolactate phosphohydrolase-like enzyme